MNLETKIQRKIAEACRDFGIIEDGDKVLVAVSGGKDSLTLLEFLAKRAKIRVPHIEVAALHVRMADVEYETDTSYMQSFANRLGVQLYIKETKANFKTEEENLLFTVPPSGTKPPCFLCSWNRRKIMFNLAQEIGFNKIALGHHQDDLIHTALMNLTFEGRFESMPPLLKMNKMPLSIIRPLCAVPESDIQAWAEHEGYLPQLKHCPYERTTNRTQIQSVFAAMEELSPEARQSIYTALKKLYSETVSHSG